MAKGQKRSNREKKKPKQNRDKKPASGAPAASSQLTEAIARGSVFGKRKPGGSK